LRQAVVHATERVREGGPMWKALESTGQFPAMMVYLIANGEATGQLESQLERAAEQQERETESALGTVMALFEPLLILFMGSVVMLIVLAILLPIFQLNQMVGL
jgi:general secretion pathway protein F